MKKRKNSRELIRESADVIRHGSKMKPINYKVQARLIHPHPLYRGLFSNERWRVPQTRALFFLLAAIVQLISVHVRPFLFARAQFFAVVSHFFLLFFNFYYFTTPVFLCLFIFISSSVCFYFTSFFFLVSHGQWRKTSQYSFEFFKNFIMK